MTLDTVYTRSLPSFHGTPGYLPLIDNSRSHEGQGMGNWLCYTALRGLPTPTKKKPVHAAVDQCSWAFPRLQPHEQWSTGHRASPGLLVFVLHEALPWGVLT